MFFSLVFETGFAANEAKIPLFARFFFFFLARCTFDKAPRKGCEGTVSSLSLFLLLDW